MLGDCEGLRFQPADAYPRGIVLHLHGGGFRQGAPEIASAFHAALAQRCQVEVTSLRYRLAPEFPFPAALADACEALRALRAQNPQAPLLVCGDSAGGGLAAGLGVLSAAGEAAAIEGLVLLSPWLDLTVDAPSYDLNAATDPLFSRAAAQVAAQLYLQGIDARHPLASPLHARLDRYPATLITVGSGEVLLHDSVRFAARLETLGVKVGLEIIEGMDHVAVTRGFSLPGSAACFEHVATFVDHVTTAHMAGASR
jgi:acetyl esterase/lipase